MPATNYRLLGIARAASTENTGDNGQKAISINALVSGGGVYLDQPTFAQATGYRLKPQGFCQDDICVPSGTAAAARGEVKASLRAPNFSLPDLDHQQARAEFALGQWLWENGKQEGANRRSAPSSDFLNK